MDANELSVSWYVLHTKSRFENVVYDGLCKKSVDVFLPKVMVRSKRRDRKLMIRVPLFPGYVFVKTDSKNHRGCSFDWNAKQPYSSTGCDHRFVEDHGRG